MSRTITAEEFIRRLNESKYAGTTVADEMLNILFKCESSDIEGDSNGYTLEDDIEAYNEGEDITVI